MVVGWENKKAVVNYTIRLGSREVRFGDVTSPLPINPFSVVYLEAGVHFEAKA